MSARWSPVGDLGYGFTGAHLELELRLPSLPPGWGLSVRRRAPASVFRCGALCGPSLLERLLRRLLSELLGFLRALHVHPSWSLV